MCFPSCGTAAPFLKQFPESSSWRIRELPHCLGLGLENKGERPWFGLKFGIRTSVSALCEKHYSTNCLRSDDSQERQTSHEPRPFRRKMATKVYPNVPKELDLGLYIDAVLCSEEETERGVAVVWNIKR